MQHETFNDEYHIDELVADNDTVYNPCNQLNLHDLLRSQLEHGWKPSEPMLNLINGE